MTETMKDILSVLLQLALLGFGAWRVAEGDSGGWEILGAGAVQHARNPLAAARAVSSMWRIR